MDTEAVVDEGADTDLNVDDADGSLDADGGLETAKGFRWEGEGQVPFTLFLVLLVSILKVQMC